MLSEHVQDSGYDLLIMFDRVSVYHDIVHVDCHISFINEVLEDVIHHGWKVARLLVRPKNMTRGLKRPKFVWKVAFHSSPSLIHTLLYPQCTSSFIKYLALESEIQLIMSGMRGSG